MTVNDHSERMITADDPSQTIQTERCYSGGRLQQRMATMNDHDEGTGQDHNGSTDEGLGKNHNEGTEEDPEESHNGDSGERIQFHSCNLRRNSICLEHFPRTVYVVTGFTARGFTQLFLLRC